VTFSKILRPTTETKRFVESSREHECEQMKGKDHESAISRASSAAVGHVYEAEAVQMSCCQFWHITVPPEWQSAYVGMGNST
jgi:hypothetical protein